MTELYGEPEVYGAQHAIALAERFAARCLVQSPTLRDIVDQAHRMFLPPDIEAIAAEVWDGCLWTGLGAPTPVEYLDDLWAGWRHLLHGPAVNHDSAGLWAQSVARFVAAGYEGYEL